VYAKNATAYGRKLLDILFSRQELKDSLLFASKKSEKAALERPKVDLLLSKCLVIKDNLLIIFHGSIV
jgi:hypothetical protein